MPDTTKPRRKKSTSPTQRALADLRKMGFTCAVTERWNAFAHIRQDLYGFCDVLAMRPGVGILAIQATGGDGGNHAARVAKLIAEPRLRTWLESGGRAEVWSYAKRGARGARKLYQLRRQEITLADLPAEPPGELSSTPAAGLFAERRIA